MTEQAKWIEQSLAGDHQAFNRLVMAYEESVMRFLRARCVNEAMAEDVFQETLINAYRYLQNYQAQYAFSTWLFSIANNAMKRHYRQFTTLDQTQLDETVAASECQQLQRDNIWRLVRQVLSTEQGNLLWLYYFEGYNGREIAKIMERSLPWVKINLLRAKQKMKQALGAVDVVA
ncbi:MAG: sigma-70 family RNA polymerase sigma factor [Gammaproteobacteria bacterium]|nr:sigma-70 family RNA polymerase sigma factor [Gammaproteobacteria bacterium]